MAACLNNGGGGSSNSGGSGGGGAEGGGGRNDGGSGRGVATNDEALLWPSRGGGTTRATNIPWREPVAASASGGFFSWGESTDAVVASFPGPGLPLPPLGRVDSEGGGESYGTGGMGARLTSKVHMIGSGMDYDQGLPAESPFGPGSSFPRAHHHMERPTSMQPRLGLEHRQLPAVPQQGVLGFSPDLSERGMAPLRRPHHLSTMSTHFMPRPDTGTSIPRAGISPPAVANADMPHSNRLNQDLLRQYMPHPDAPHLDMARSEVLHSDVPNADFRHRNFPHARSQGSSPTLSPSQGIWPRMGKAPTTVSGAKIPPSAASMSLTERIQHAPPLTLSAPAARTSAPPKPPKAVAKSANQAACRLPQQIQSPKTASPSGSLLLPAPAALREPLLAGALQASSSASERCRNDISTPGIAPAVPDPCAMRAFPVAPTPRAPETVNNVPTATIQQQPQRSTGPAVSFVAPSISARSSTPKSAPASALVSAVIPAMTRTAAASGPAPTNAPSQGLKPAPSPKLASAPKSASALKPASAPRSASAPKRATTSKLAPKPKSTPRLASAPKQASVPKPTSASKPASTPKPASSPKPASLKRPSPPKPASSPNQASDPKLSRSPKPLPSPKPASKPSGKVALAPKPTSAPKPIPKSAPKTTPTPKLAPASQLPPASKPAPKPMPTGSPEIAPKPTSTPWPTKLTEPATDAASPTLKRSLKGETAKASKRAKIEIRPFSAPIEEPPLQVPEVSAADVGKVVLSETHAGTLTGVVEGFIDRSGLGVWSIRYENGEVMETDDCGELHDDMCSYFEFAGHAATAPGSQVESSDSFWLQEKVRERLLKEDTCIVGRRVCAVQNNELREGEVTEYVPPTRDGEIEQWRVVYAGGEYEDFESFELVLPLLRYVEKRIERREVQWGHRKLPAYVHRAGGRLRAFATLAGISASLPTTTCNDDDD